MSFKYTFLQKIEDNSVMLKLVYNLKYYEKEKGEKNMNDRKTRVLSICFTAMLVLGMLAAIRIPLAKAATTYMEVRNPLTGDKWFNFTSDYYGTGTGKINTFKVEVWVRNITNLYNWQVALSWDTALLTTSAAQISLEGSIFNYTTNKYHAPSPALDLDAGWLMWGEMLLDPEPPWSGTGLLLTVEFTIIKDPERFDYVWCDLHLRVPPDPMPNCFFEDPDGKTIDFTPVDGYYELRWAPPAIYPYLSVEPDLVEKTDTTPFTVGVYLNDLDKEWHLTFVQFYLFYNSTLLYTDETMIDFTNNYLRTYATYGIWETARVESSMWIPEEYSPPWPRDPTLRYVIVGIYIEPNATGVYPPGFAFPEGRGLLVEITFQPAYQGEFPEVDECDLELHPVNFGNPAYFLDEDQNKIPEAPPHHGHYIIYGLVRGRMIDVYTQYQYPYGGQGPNRPSDMFWPQKEVELYANVTYNEWPVQNKTVAFEIRNPQGELVTVLTALSDEYGVAHTSFRIPWPCDDPESLFGVWTVIATVDIACIVVNDTLQFHFDYLVQWIKVTTDKTDYAHCENITITIEFQSYAMQERPVLITVVVHDELNYPVGIIYVNTTVSGAEWCQYKLYSVEVKIHVPKHAAAGTATIHVNALSTLPSLGGSAWTPEITKTVRIKAEWAP